MDVLTSTALFVRDLLSYDEELIRIGRLNFTIDGFEDSYIGVDSISPAIRLGGGQYFDETSEVMEYQEQWRIPVILSFYGTDAHTNANTLRLYLQSQASIELQQTLGIAVFKGSSLTDIKILTGQNYNNRLDLTINVEYSISANIDTLRIDTAETTLIIDN